MAKKNQQNAPNTVEAAEAKAPAGVVTTEEQLQDAPEKAPESAQEPAGDSATEDKGQGENAPDSAQDDAAAPAASDGNGEAGRVQELQQHREKLIDAASILGVPNAETMETSVLERTVTWQFRTLNNRAEGLGIDAGAFESGRDGLVAYVAAVNAAYTNLPRTYIVQWTLKRNGRTYEAGDEIHLTDDQAASLGAVVKVKA